MKREIKFRAWDDINKEMVYAISQDYFATGPTNGNLVDRCDELMQFTGLLDKNGVEIYEGDIVTFYEANGNSKFQATVEYRSTSCSFIMMWETIEDGRPVRRFKGFDANMGGEDGVYQTYIEVAGNIHQP